MSREDIATALAADITAFINGDTPDDVTFDILARRLFAYQHEFNVPYRRFCNGRDASPDSVENWRQIPAAPAAAFKSFALTCAPEDLCTPEHGGRIFHSSGTTGAETSRHLLDAAALDLYRASLRAGYRRFIPVETAGIVALMPTPAEAPHSSLSFMLEDLGAEFVSPQGDWAQQFATALRDPDGVRTYFGTAFAWVNLLDTVSERFQLPEGSIVLETGGFKGRSREISREELYALFAERLGVPPTHAIAEYGMSEMASQFYDSALIDSLSGRQRPSRKVAPYWLKTRIIDPITSQEAEPGQPGLLAHYDLANLNSVLAIQTEDYGHTAEDGDGFILLGRAPGAILRGCSLTAEEMANM